MKPADTRAIITAFVVAVLAGALFSAQARTGFEPPEAILDLRHPASFLGGDSGGVGPSPVGLLQWQGDTPFRAHLPFLGPPAELRLKLLPERPGTVLDVRIDGRPIARIDLAPTWTLYRIEPRVAGEVLELSLGPGSAAGPVHLSAVRTSAITRRSSHYPRYWVVPAGSGQAPPGPLVRPLVSIVLVAITAAGTMFLAGSGGLVTWLRLVVPGTVVLAAAELATRAAGLELLYPPTSFPALLLLPGVLGLLWLQRGDLRARGFRLWDRLRPSLVPVGAAVARHPSRMLGVVALALWAWVLTGLATERFGGDPRGLVHFGSRHDTASFFSGVEPVGPSGYDGQFYAVLATDPILLDPTTLNHLDTPSYRAPRILVPALAWVLGLGQNDASLRAYIALCWLLALAVVPLTAMRLERDGSSGWWAAPLLLNAGLVATLTRVTVDGAALFFLLLAFESHRRGRTGGTTLAATAAALTREVFVVGGMALACVELFRRRWRSALLQGLVPVAAIGLWRLRVAAAVTEDERLAPELFTVPFAWLPEKVSQIGELALQHPFASRVELVCLAAVAISLLASIPVLRRATADPAVLCLAAFGTLGLFLSYEVYEEAWAFTRILWMVPVLGLLVSGGRRWSTATVWALRGAACLWAVAGCYLLSLIS